MKNIVKIGDNEYPNKKSALAFYKNILNQYSFGSSLNNEHFTYVLDLMNYAWFSDFPSGDSGQDNILNLEKIAPEITVIDILVSKVQFGARCFEVFYSNDESQYISYIMLVNRKNYTDEQLFNVACRNSVYEDINKVKQEYFKNNAVNGVVRCQETNVVSKWEELVVDHRQPNTFSIIIDRFKEINGVDLGGIKYASASNNMIIFSEIELTEKFKKYHREKANLRVVRKECNASRSSMARSKRNNKDLSITKPEQLSLF